jgi:hypothetical protein
MGVADLRAALVKMTNHARLRCYATLNVGGHYLSPDLSRLLDRDIAPRPDYIYAVNILYRMGIKREWISSAPSAGIATPPKTNSSPRSPGGSAG